MNTSPYMHERLMAYREALEFYKLARVIRAGLPRGMGPLGDQLARASQSVVLNLAEGAASRSRDVKICPSNYTSCCFHGEDSLEH